MSKIDDGGPAFPASTICGVGQGMTLRDWFAGMALPMALDMWKECDDKKRMLYSGCVDIGIIFQRDFPNFVANVTGWIADAMIAEKRRTEGGAA